jgi:type II secretory pathway component PulF
MERARRLRDPTHWPFVRTYALVLLILVPGIITILSIFVMPKFNQILKDFGMWPPPPAMRWVIALSQGVAPMIAAAGAILFLVAGQVAVEQFGAPSMRWWQARHGYFRTTIDRIRWIMPIVGRLDRDRGLADVMATVAEALEAQRPLNLAVAEAHQPHLNAVLAERVNEWGQGVAAGMSPGDAAARASLPSIVSGLLGTTRPAPNIAAVCRFLERYYRSRFSRLQLLLREATVPLLALFGGAAVVLVALAVFQPMIVLLERVATIQVRP